MCPTCDSGFTVMGSDVGVPSTLQSNALLEIPVKPPTAQASCTKSVSECTREAWPRYNTWLRDYKPVQWMLRPTVAPQK